MGKCITKCTNSLRTAAFTGRLPATATVVHGIMFCGEDMNLFKHFILLFTLILPGLVSAEDDGNELLRNCNAYVKYSNGETLNEAEEIDALTCNQYILGFKDSLILSGDMLSKVCIPGEVMSDQVARVVVKHLKLNPEILHKKRGATLLYALEKGFPCAQ